MPANDITLVGNRRSAASTSFFFQDEDGIRCHCVTGVQTCALPIFVEKHNRYSNWEARVSADQRLCGSASKIQTGSVKGRRKLKLLSQYLPCRPFLRFLYIYVWQRGFLDGREGYYFARLHAFYEFLSVAKTYELKRKM